MASLQCSKPAEHSQHHQKHDQHQHQHQHQQEHCLSHVSDKIKGVFKGHHQGQPPAVAHGHSANASAGHCKPPGSKKKEHCHKNNEGGLLHKIKDAFSDHSSDSSDSDNECNKAHHKRKNLKEKKCS